MIHSAAPTWRTGHLRRYDRALDPGQGVAHVNDALARWGLAGDEEQALDAVLVAGELLANACQHGGGIRRLELSWRGQWLRIAVSDASPLLPRPVWPHDPARPSGHGLFLVERLATRWGTDPRPGGGKTVWAEFHARHHR